MAGPIGARVQRRRWSPRPRHAHPRHHVLRHAPPHDVEQGRAARPPTSSGFKLRVPENDVFKAMAEAWGAKPTPMNFGELYLALKQGVVDGQENPLPTIKSGKFDEVQKYLVLTGHIITPRLVVVNESVLEGPVSRPTSKIIAGRGRRPASRGRTPSSASQEKALVDTFKAGRHDGDHARRRRVPQAGARRRRAESSRAEWGKGTYEKLQADPVGRTSVRHRGVSRRADAPPCTRRARDALRRFAERVDRRGSRSRRSPASSCACSGRSCFRYVLDSPLTWSDELARYLFVWCAFLGWIDRVAPRAAISRSTFVVDAPAARARRRAIAAVVQVATLLLRVAARRRAACAARAQQLGRRERRGAVQPRRRLRDRADRGAVIAVMRCYALSTRCAARGRCAGAARTRVIDADARDPRGVVRRALRSGRRSVARDGARRLRVPASRRHPGPRHRAAHRHGGRLVPAARRAAVHPDGQHHELAPASPTGSSTSRGVCVGWMRGGLCHANIVG